MGICSNKAQVPLSPPLRDPTPTPTPPPPTPPPPPPTPPRENTEDFSSDHIDVKIDQASDEIKVEDKLPGYQAPTPPDKNGGQIKKKNIWFEDDEFNLASDDADLFNVDIGQDDDNVEDELDDNSITPSQTKRSACPVIKYDEIDEHAKRAGAEVRSSFEMLLQYLAKKTGDNRYKQVLLARAIIVWMSAQSIDDENYGEANRESPNGLLQSLKNRTMTYSACFAIICRKANMQCVKIKGYVKAAGYEPGETDIPETTWNAVFVETGWQIIHPYWICRALYGHNLGGWVKVEKDGQSMRTKEKASNGIIRNTFHDRYFMPDPEEFLYECCAKDPAWQLVKQSVPSKLMFAKMPYLLPPFFGVGLTLISQHNCELDSENGFCKIELKGNPANAHMLVLRYELFLKSDASDQEEDDQQSRMVFNVRAGDLFTFDIRFLNTGIYKLVVYGGPHKSPALRLFETKLNCDRQMAGRNLLPLSCPKVGWGPGPFSREAGLIMPSRISGLIGVSKSLKTAEISFHLQDNKTSYSAVVHGEVDGRRKTFDNSIAVSKSNQDKLLTITATIPGEGEYGVAINVLTAKGKEERNVCNYLLSTYAFKGTKANVKNAKKRLHDTITENVKPCDWTKKIDSIEECISRCKKERIPDTDEDIVVASSELNHLRCRNLLRDCELRQNLHVVRNTLSRVYHYKNKSLLQKEIENVQLLEQTLIAQKGYTAVPSLKEASHRIANLLHCPSQVELILKAVFILTGESKISTYDWNSIAFHLRRKRTTLIERMSQLKTTSIPKDRIQNVQKILKTLDDDHIRAVNVDAYRFYQWLASIVATQ